MTLATLLVCNDRGRLNLLAHAERSLSTEEVIVQVKDLVGRRRSYRTTPLSSRAELVATEPPLVLRGGLTTLVLYYRVPAKELDATEHHYERGEFSHEYDVRMRIMCRGTAVPSAMTA